MTEHRCFQFCLGCILLARAATAHVGSPDTFFEGRAGPYRLLVTVRTPGVVPGVAEIEIRSAEADVREVRVAAMRLTGDGAKYPPAPELMQRSHEDPQFFTGSVWLMELGSFQVRLLAEGKRGKGELAVPVPVIASRTLGMQPVLGGLLLGLGVLLGVGVVSIVGAGAREGRLEAGARPEAPQHRRARRAMIGVAAAVIVVVYLGSLWWKAEAGSYAGRIYQPPHMQASLEDGARLRLRLQAENFILRQGDLIPDHSHLMHLYLVRWPQMDWVWHLHPDQTAEGDFLQELPSTPSGEYRLFGDVVFRSGFPATALAEMRLPEMIGKPLAGDDSGGPLLDGRGSEQIVWERDNAPLVARRAGWLRFHLEDAEGRTLDDLEPYMGMAGHAAFIARDGSVFAHVHPSGSVPMASLDLVAAHSGHTIQLGPTVSFPYGFPKAGEYCIIMQVKRAGAVLTQAFDATVN